MYQQRSTAYVVGSNGDVTPSRTIVGYYMQVCSPTGIAVTAAGEIYVDDAPGGTKLLQTITKGVYGGQSLIIGSLSG
jgi:hypothetical protein